MKPISARIHGVIDYATIAAFAMAPTLLDLPAVPAMLCYIMAASYGIVTLITDMPLGMIHLLPFRGHGAIEFLSAPILIAAPWLFGFYGHDLSRWLFVGAGILTLVVFSLTDWKNSQTVPSHTRLAR
jgi:hypothetical protein